MAAEIPAIPRPRRSGVVVPEQPAWHGRLAAALIYGLVRSVDATLRYRWQDDSGLFEGRDAGPAIFAIWHNRLALSLRLYQRHVQRLCAGHRLAAMVSASKDGALLARVLEHFGVAPVRGSSSRRGPQALLELISWAERGYDLAITPDGPRGPRYVVQEGAIALAQLSGLPVVPVSYSLGWKMRAKSWDQFQIPLPGSRVRAVFGPPLRVPRDVDDAQRETLRRQLEAALLAITVD